MFNGFEWSLYRFGGNIVRARIKVFEPPNCGKLVCVRLSGKSEGEASEPVDLSAGSDRSFQPIGLNNDNRLEKLWVGRKYKDRNSALFCGIHTLREVRTDPDAGNEIIVFTTSNTGGTFIHPIEEFLDEFEPVENPG